MNHKIQAYAFLASSYSAIGYMMYKAVFKAKKRKRFVIL